VISKRQVLITAWNLWRTKQSSLDDIQAQQQTRLQAIIEYARQYSPYYKQLYQHLPPHIDHLSDLPIVTKRNLMAHFNEWVTDVRIRRDEIDTFIADPSLMGVPYLGRYAVWRTSGTTGSPGIFLHDPDALILYTALVLQRGYLSWINWKLFWMILRRTWRVAFVFATGGHFASNVFEVVSHHIRPSASDTNPIFSAHMPLADLVQTLNEYQPVILTSYPSVLEQLAKEQVAGRLRIHPVLVIAGGECLKQQVSRQIVTAFHCSLHDAYLASEFMGIAFDCGHGRLHLNMDWVMLEAVDSDYQPISAGDQPHTVLLTNLVNRVQPIIRYELGDSIRFYADDCPCGSPLPSIHVEGRDDEILTFEKEDGVQVELMPIPLQTILMVMEGIQRYQLIKTAPLTLQVRVEFSPDADTTQVWESLEAQLRAYLDRQGLPSVKIEKSDKLPQPSAISAKFRHVWSEYTDAHKAE
jgi:putative adenylate-forming enzyme